MMVSAQDYQSYYQRYLWDLEEPWATKLQPRSTSSA